MKFRAAHAMIVFTALSWLVMLALGVSTMVDELHCDRACAGLAHLWWTVAIPSGVIAALAGVGILYGQSKVRRAGVVALCIILLLLCPTFLVGMAGGV